MKIEGSGFPARTTVGRFQWPQCDPAMYLSSDFACRESFFGKKVLSSTQSSSNTHPGRRGKASLRVQIISYQCLVPKQKLYEKSVVQLGSMLRFLNFFRKLKKIGVFDSMYSSLIRKDDHSVR
jgi:hypothetical protein